MTLSASLNQRIQTQIESLENALRNLQSGSVPDMAPLEHDVASLCKDLLAAPSQESYQTAEKMREMIGLLESLALELKDFHSSLSAPPQG